MYTHQKQIIEAGTPPGEAAKAAILLHGRGASAQDILSLRHHLKLDGMALYAPQASRNSWYPYSFMAPEAHNQPALGSALQQLADLVAAIGKAGISPENLYLFGFSQGACLALEYAARYARRYAGIIAFTGGLVGEELVKERYQGDFAGTPVLVTTGDADPHVPLHRVNDSVAILDELSANVDLHVFPGKPHSISQEEVELANRLLSS
jgi:phospholipase/carboxylesterase